MQLTTCDEQASSGQVADVTPVPSVNFGRQKSQTLQPFASTLTNSSFAAHCTACSVHTGSSVQRFGRQYGQTFRNNEWIKWMNANGINFNSLFLRLFYLDNHYERLRLFQYLCKSIRSLYKSTVIDICDDKLGKLEKKKIYQNEKIIKSSKYLDIHCSKL